MTLDMIPGHKISKVDLKINSGTRMKLENFANMIRSFQIEMQSKNAFEVADLVIKKTRIIKDIEILKKEN